ncbi:MAG: xanthine dehydrogenase family protein, partial [Gammaproteobacteria bacterium]|nr:xanthine dehydrogenase family protein [Gammaproteobacteria bacterium]
MSDSLPFQPRFIGQPVPRIEDPLLLSGRATLVDDLQFPGMLHMAMLRSPHAHARINSIDTKAACDMPGVEAVVTGAEIKAATRPLGAMPAVGEGWTGHAMAVDKVRYCGEIVAAVVAVSREVAEDALEQIWVDYEELPPVVDLVKAATDESALLYEQQESNVLFQRDYIYGEPDSELSKADLVIRGNYSFPRVSGNPMETNGVITQWDTMADELNCWCNAQTRASTVASFLLDPPGRDHVIAQPHGGSFGTKLYLLKYQLITAIASRKTGGRHIKYIEDRIEHLMASGTHAWDRRYEAAFGFTSDGVCTAMHFRCLNDCGASAENNAPSMCWKPIVMLAGPYRVDHVRYDLTAVVTNKSPEGAYRGYGCPPHTLVIERLMDKAAKALNLEPTELRRRNLIGPDEFPYTTPAGTDYDSGDYPGLMDLATSKAGYDELRKLQAQKRAEGKLVGIAAVLGIEPGGVWAVTGPYRDWTGGRAVINPESVGIRLDEAGRLDVEVYYALEGQGQYTFAAQIVADYFGVDMSMVRVGQAGSKTRAPSMGPAGSRQAVALSEAILGASEKLASKLKAASAILFQTDTEQLKIVEGAVQVNVEGGPALPLGQVAAAMIHRPDLLPDDLDGNPQAMHTWRAPGEVDAEGSPYLTYACACHVVMVEVDRETGITDILKYVLADDCGTRLNPASVEGQVQGGIAQGVGAALYEEYRYDEYGQPLAVSYADYLMPTITEVPMVEKHAMVTPSPNTTLGVKG